MTNRLAIFAAVTLAACATNSSTAQLSPAPPPGGQQLASTPYTLQPGQEKYFCWTFRSPDQLEAITKVQPISGKLVHHLVLFSTTGQAEPDGFFECPQLVKLNWRPIWAEGTGGQPLTVPDGVGFQIPANTQYLVQFHLLNATDNAITERSGINLTYAKDPSSLMPAGIFALGTLSLDIPANQSDYTVTAACNADKAFHAFAAFPHMHQLGTKLEFTTNGQMAYKIDPWVFGNQPMDPVSIDVAQGEPLSATCHWNNTTGHDVKFGESTTDEMCFMVLFAYPMTDADGCVM